MSKQKTRSTLEDWHPEDIQSAIRKRCGSVANLARAHGYDRPSTFANVFRVSYPKVERIIAEFLGEKPEHIWPSRYEDRNTKSGEAFGNKRVDRKIA